MRRNWFTTVGGIMAGFGLIPIALGSSGIHMPSWLYLVCVVLATMGPVVVGVGAKGADEHSTLDQVNQSTTQSTQKPNGAMKQ